MTLVFWLALLPGVLIWAGFGFRRGSAKALGRVPTSPVRRIVGRALLSTAVLAALLVIARLTLLHNPESVVDAWLKEIAVAIALLSAAAVILEHRVAPVLFPLLIAFSAWAGFLGMAAEQHNVKHRHSQHGYEPSKATPR